MKYLALFTLILFASCSKTDSVDPKTLEPFREFSAVVDGEPWEQDGGIDFYRRNPKWIEFQASDGVSPKPVTLRLIFKEYDSLNPRVYQLRYPGNKGDSSYVEVSKDGRQWQSYDGEINIVSTGEVINATFHAKLTQRDKPTDTFEITNGKFKYTK